MAKQSRHTLKSLHTRRKFISNLGGFGAMIILPSEISWALQNPDDRVKAIVAKTIGIDTHNHIDVPLIASELPGPEADLAGDMLKSGLSAICMTFAVDYQRLVNPGDAYERFMNGLTAMDAMLKNNKISRALRLSDIKTAHSKKLPTVIQSVEGAHFLEGKIERLATAYKRGLRHLCLLHDNDASVPLGDVFTNPVRWNGLTSLGSEVISECERLGILVDLSHASNDTLNAALKQAKKPVLVSHTGLDTRPGTNERMAKMMAPRLISQEQAKIVADKGGLIGVWTHLADTPIEYAHNIRAMVDVAGIDHVCIGTDTKLTPPYRSPNQANGRGGPPNQSGNPPAQGTAPAPQNQERVGERTNKAWADQTTGFYFAVVDAMLKTGFSEEQIAKIVGANYCRIFDAATSGHN